MVLCETVFWVTWSSLNGAEASTLHPASVPAVLDNVDERLLSQYKAFAPQLQAASTTSADFFQTLLRPSYDYDERRTVSHPAIRSLTPDDLIRCRSLGLQQPQNSSADCDYNVLLNTMFERFSAYEYMSGTVPSYDATPDEHRLLLKMRGQTPPECGLRPRPATRTLMRMAQKVFDPTLANG